MDTVLQHRLNLSLLLLRIGVVIVMGIWTIDKFVNPAHASAVFAHFYHISDLSVNTSYILGVLQLAIVVCFLAGFMRTWSYGLVFLMHAGSTLSSYARYIEPWEKTNLLFFAAWPMLAALAVLFILREYDNWTIDAKRLQNSEAIS